MRKSTIWVPTRSGTHRAVQSQKMVRGWKFWIQLVEELYYSCSENKGADQRRSNYEAYLRLCFRPSIFFVFLYAVARFLSGSIYEFVFVLEAMEF